MTDNELSITTDDIVSQARAYKRGYITEQKLFEYIEAVIQLVEVQAEKAQMQKDYEDTQKILGVK